MANSLYWVSALTYAVVLSIILVNEIRVKKSPNKEERAFRLMMKWVIFFCLQDTVWGLCEQGVIAGDGAFFVSSSVFHISTVITTFFWLYYALIYVGGKNRWRQVMLLIDGFLVALEVVLVGINCFRPIMFHISDGKYVPDYLRPVTFSNQYLVYLTVGIVALVVLVRDKGENPVRRDRYITVFGATFAPILLGIFQLLFPDSPFYSMGYFLCCFIVHIFVVTKDRENIEKTNVLKSIANTYYTMHLINMETDAVQIYLEPEQIRNLHGDTNKASEIIVNIMKGVTCEDYLKYVLDFVNLSTLVDRMGDRTQISIEFVGRNYGWTRMSFVVVDRAEDVIRTVMVTSQIIDAEKREQMELLFKSNNDELTGLYNRRAFEDEIKKIEGDEDKDMLYFVSMDVNGLKVVNDTLGHAAGDELLTAAAECMKKNLGEYGKIFRTGGDEFIAIIRVSKKQMDQIVAEFDKDVKAWSGKLVDHLAISLGYARTDDVPSTSVHDTLVLADERMYKNKAEYYQSHGVDRRRSGD